MSIDRLSYMLSAIKNAAMVNKSSVEVTHTKECEAVAKVLKKQGFLTEVKVFKESGSPIKKLHLDFATDTLKNKITDLKRVSRPGRRIYIPCKSLGRSANGFGVYVVSTSRGMMSDNEARKKKLGGEVICEVY